MSQSMYGYVNQYQMKFQEVNKQLENMKEREQRNEGELLS